MCLGGAAKVRGRRAADRAWLGPTCAPWFGFPGGSPAHSVWPRGPLLRESGEGAAGHTSLACPHRTGPCLSFRTSETGREAVGREETRGDGPKLPRAAWARGSAGRRLTSQVYLRSVAECELPARPTGLPLAPLLRECQLSGLLSAPGAPLIRSRSQHLQNSLPLADLKVCPVLPPTLCPSPPVPRMGGIRLYVFLGRADCM